MTIENIYLDKGNIKQVPLETTRVRSGELRLILDIYDDANNFISRKTILTLRANSILIGLKELNLNNDKLLIYPVKDSCIFSEEIKSKESKLILLKKIRNVLLEEI